jgi:hypothetical protein
MSKSLNFVMMHHHVIDTPAWRSASHGSRSLYMALKRRWISSRKNLVYLSERVAAKELGSDRNQIRRWFRELIYYGFIVMERPGYLGLNGKGKAPHWRLTECETFAPKGSLAPTVQATRDFDKWNRIPFSVAGGFCARKKKQKNPNPAEVAQPKYAPPPPRPKAENMAVSVQVSALSSFLKH